MPISAGTRLGKYEIIAPLGAGAMGEVYRARDSRLGRDVAVKLLPALAAAEGRSERAVAIATAAYALSERAGIVIAHPMDPGVVSRIDALKASIPKARLEGLVANAGVLSPAAVLAMVSPRVGEKRRRESSERAWFS